MAHWQMRNILLMVAAFMMLILVALPNAHAQQVVAPLQKTLTLEINKGTLIKLNSPAEQVFIADPEIADVQVKSPSMIYLFGRQPGDTVVYAVDRNGDVTLSKPISVNHNLSRLKKALDEVIPGHQIKLSSIDGAIVLAGKVFSPSDAEDARRMAVRVGGSEDEVINQLKVETSNQVNLRVRIAEVSRDTIKDLGFNWEAGLNAGSVIFGIATGNPLFSAGTLITRSDGVNNLNLGYNEGNVDLDVLFDALEDEGLISVLAEPNLTALSGETAEFLAGGEFPVPTAQDDDRISVEYRPFGVSLAFTPTLISGNRINLRVRPEVSQLTNVGAIQVQNLIIPALSTRRAETTVELGSGQSFAIAGLIQQNTQDDLSKLPGAGDVPVLGPLFRSDRFQRSETELVIVVTPYIVKPVPAEEIVLPTDAYTKKLAENIVPPAKPKIERQTVGDVGFLID